MVYLYIIILNETTMKRTVKIYVVSTNFSSREIQARNKKEAVALFRSQLGAFVSDTDKITIR